MGQRLLVVDSDRRFIKEHQVALESAFDVDFLFAPEGVIPRLEQGGHAATLICVEVGENKGYALCTSIRRNPALADIKVVLISAKATEEEFRRHQSLRGRADLYLHKPIGSSELIVALGPYVPASQLDPNNPLGDLDGVSIGDEWLESLKGELDLEMGSARPETPPAESTSAEPPPLPPSPVLPAAATPPLPPSRVPPVAATPTAAPPPTEPTFDPFSTMTISSSQITQKMAALNLEAQKAAHVADPEALAALRTALDEKSQELATREAELAERAEQISRADAAFQELQGRHDAALRDLQETARLRAEAEALNERFRQAEEAMLRAASGPDAEVEELRGQLNRTTEEGQSLLQQVHELGGQVNEKSQQISELLRSRDNVQQLLLDAQAEVDRLKGREETLHGQSSRLLELEQAQAAGRAELDQVRDEREKQTRELARRDEELHAQREILEAKHREASQGLEELQKRHEETLRERESELTELRDDRAGLEATLRGQRRELADQDHRINVLDKENGELRTENQGLKRELEDLRIEVTGLRDRTSSQEESFRALSGEAEYLRTELEATQSTSREQSQLLEVQTSEAEAFRVKVHEQEAILEVQAAELDQLRDRMQQRDAAEASMSAELAELRARTFEQDRVLASRIEDVEALKAECERMASQCGEVEKQMGKIVSQYEFRQIELLQGLDDKEAVLAELNQTLAGQKEAMEALGRENQEFKDRLAAQMERARVFNQMLVEVEDKVHQVVSASQDLGA